MPALPTRELKIGSIIDKSLGVVEHSLVPSLIYLLGIGALNVANAYFTADMASISLRAIISLVLFVISISAAYMLLDAMLRTTGLRERQQDEVFFGYIGLSLLYSLGVGLGIVLLVLPGLLVMARWSIAQPLLVARGEGVMKSLGESWERTRGNEFSIIAAALALIVLPVGIIIAVAVLLDPTNLASIVVTQFATAAITVVTLAMGVALYGVIMGGRAAAFS